MPDPYTPAASPSFVSFPIDLILKGDPMTPDSMNVPFRAAFDSLQRLKLDTDEDIGVMAALKTKLGITVVDSSDTALPTYSGAYVLTSALSHHAALNTLDTELGLQNVKFTNIDANVGGSVTGASAPVYASSGVVFPDGTSHHGALEALEDYAVTSRSLATTASSDASTAVSTATNVAAKLGTGAELAPDFDWTYELLISDGDKVKDIIDVFDAILYGSRRLADQAFGQAVANYMATEPTANASFYDTLIDTTKRSASTTASIDVLTFEATGDGTDYIATFTAPATVSEIAFLWDISAGATITFHANAIGSLGAGDFVTISAQRTFVAFAASGTDIVIKASITGASSKLFNIAAIVKP